LGDAIEADTLYVLPQGHDGCALALTLDTDTVFEDVTPRIADVTGDAQEDIITIESDAQAGAALAIYSIKNNQLIRVAATPFIGTRYRWLAPIGTADFNRDNIADVAYVERPHLAGVLMIWSFAGEQPVLLASQPGFSNHRIGENYNTGGIATCGDTPQIIIPDRRWQQTMAITLKNDQLAAAAVAPDISPATIDKYLACR
ncbi:MAG: VCBS repeat-containing protein, partial [Pseudomonadota bacterium]